MNSSESTMNSGSLLLQQFAQQLTQEGTQKGASSSAEDSIHSLHNHDSTLQCMVLWWFNLATSN